MPAPRRPAAPALIHHHRAAAPGSRTVVLIHPGALPATVHRATASALPETTGLTVLDLQGLPAYRRTGLPGTAGTATLDQLVPPLAAEVTRLREAGPFTLGGWSFGGVVAHAVCGGLPAELRPDRVVLLDSIAATEEYTRTDDALEPALLLGWFAMYLGAKRGRPVSGPLPGDAIRDTDEGLATVLRSAVASGALPGDVTLPGLRKLYETYVEGLLHNNRLTARHRPPSAVVPLTLIKAERSLISGDPDLGWGPLAAHGLTVRSCPGDHYTMLGRPDAATVIAHVIQSA
ncbi:thioesterase [Streptomyces bohaiensis]|uniref:Thioesterase n=1 Tax=Streptomyces bohaiensis TaxID=1431344 RepID=A0ABX1C7S9_9ACTN|nr:thioesterase [Streptomyces bohaiensis]